MDPGALKHTITITVPKREKQPDLSYKTVEAPVCSPHAAVKGMRMSDEVAAGAERLNQMLQFTIRWRAGITTDMTIDWQGRCYDIEYVDPTPFDRLYMRIRAISRDGVGGAQKGGGQGGTG